METLISEIFIAHHIQMIGFFKCVINIMITITLITINNKSQTYNDTHFAIAYQLLHLYMHLYKSKPCISFDKQIQFTLK